MSSNTFTVVIWVAIVVYMWRQAHKAENQRLGSGRSERDGLRLVVSAGVLAIAFVVVLYLLPQIAVRIPWSVGYLSISGAIAVLLGVVFLFGVGLFLARKSERLSTKHIVRETLYVFGASLLIIAVLGGLLALSPYFGVTGPMSVWFATGILTVAILGKGLISLLLKRRRQLPR